MPRGPLRKCYDCFISGRRCCRSHLIKVPTARPLLEKLLYSEFFITKVEESEEFVSIFKKYHEGKVTLYELLDNIDERRFKRPMFGKRGIRIISRRKRARIAIEMYGVEHRTLNDTKI